jgi:hypothetical protein
MEDAEHAFEHYLQGHYVDEVAAKVRREVRLGTVSCEGFVRLDRLFSENREALDDRLAEESVVFESGYDSEGRYIQLERTPVAQEYFQQRFDTLS